MKTKYLTPKEYRQLITDIKNRHAFGDATYAERNILNIHNKKQKQNGKKIKDI